MITRMNMVQNAARLAMADHRTADPLPNNTPGSERLYRAGVVLATVLAVAVTLALLAGLG